MKDRNRQNLSVVTSPLPVEVYHSAIKTRRTFVTRSEIFNRKQSAQQGYYASPHGNKNRLGGGFIRHECNRKWAVAPCDISRYEDKFVIVSYNILAADNVLKHQYLYSGVPLEYLEWDRRIELISKEMNLYKPGIICFQEVDRYGDLNAILQKGGYRGVYKARTGGIHDGCAIFWNKRRFTLLHEENIEFCNFGLRDNVAQLCVFKMTGNQSSYLDKCVSGPVSVENQVFLVGNIHVLFNPKRGDIKLGQVRLFLDKAYCLSQEWGGIPVVLSGDLNSLPQSAIYEFVASSKLNILLHDRKNVSGHRQHFAQPKCRISENQNLASSFLYKWSAEELKLATGGEGVSLLEHQLKLSSAYPRIRGENLRSRDKCGEPSVTSYHNQFMGTVDYIWHTQDLVPLRVLETLPVDVLRRSSCLPDKRCGSDHLALVCELAFAAHGSSVS